MAEEKKTIFISRHKIRNKSKSILSPARFVREFPCHESLSHGTKKSCDFQKKDGNNGWISAQAPKIHFQSRQQFSGEKETFLNCVNCLFVATQNICYLDDSTTPSFIFSFLQSHTTSQFDTYQSWNCFWKFSD